MIEIVLVNAFKLFRLQPAIERVLIDEHDAVVVKLLNDHVADGGFSRRGTTGNTCTITHTINHSNFGERERERGKKVEIPMTKGGLGRRESRVESAGGVVEVDGDDGERPSKRRPEKWGPEAASMT